MIIDLIGSKLGCDIFCNFEQNKQIVLLLADVCLFQQKLDKIYELLIHKVFFVLNQI